MVSAWSGGAQLHKYIRLLPAELLCWCSAASADLVEKSQAAQKLLKVVIAGLSEDAHSEEVRKVPSMSTSSSPLAKLVTYWLGMLNAQIWHAAAAVAVSIMHAHLQLRLFQAACGLKEVRACWHIAQQAHGMFRGCSLGLCSCSSLLNCMRASQCAAALKHCAASSWGCL